MTVTYALKRAKMATDDFGRAYWTLIAKDVIGYAWLKKPLTGQEKRRRLTKLSDYGSSYWTTEPRGSFGAVKCDVCGGLVKRQYPWFRMKECRFHKEVA